MPADEVKAAVYVELGRRKPTEEQLTTNLKIFEGSLADYYSRRIGHHRAMQKRLKHLIVPGVICLILSQTASTTAPCFTTLHEDALEQFSIRDQLPNTKQASERGAKSVLAYIMLLTNPQRHDRDASDPTRRFDALFGELWLDRADGANNRKVTGSLKGPVAALLDRIHENEVGIPQETKKHPAPPGLSGQFDTTK